MTTIEFPHWDYPVGGKRSSPELQKWIRENSPKATAIWTRIFDHLTVMSPEWDKPHIFTNGESDSNQTKYEQLVNTLKIGVSANSVIEGRVLLWALRVIIDNHDVEYMLEAFGECLEDCVPDQPLIMNLDDFLRGLSSRERAYSEDFEFGKEISNELSGCRNADYVSPQDDPDIIETITSTENTSNFVHVTTKITRTQEKMLIWDLDKIRTTLLTNLVCMNLTSPF